MRRARELDDDDEEGDECNLDSEVGPIDHMVEVPASDQKYDKYDSLDGTGPSIHTEA